MGLAPTRQQILELLKKSGGMTVDELSHALGISTMGVRQHLAILEKEGLIQDEKRRGKMGRPAHIYFLSPRGNELFPRQYESLAISILETIAEMDGREKINNIFERHMEHMYQTYAPYVLGRDLRTRIEELARLQQNRGFMAEWTEEADGFYLREHNCTIARVAQRFPQACRYELALFQKLLGVKMQRVRCMANGDPCCEYRITAAGENKDGVTEQVACRCQARAQN